MQQLLQRGARYCGSGPGSSRWLRAVLSMSRTHFVVYVHTPNRTHPNFFMCRPVVPFSSAFVPRSAMLFSDCTFLIVFLAQLQPQVTQVKVSRFSQSLPDNGFNSRICVHLQFPGIETRSPALAPYFLFPWPAVSPCKQRSALPLLSSSQ